MGYVVSVFSFFIGIIKRNKKISFAVTLLAIFVLFGWSTETADYGIYANRFYNYNNVAATTEPIYTFLMYICNLLGLEYREWVTILAIIYVLSIFIVCKRFAKENPAFPVAMMILFPLCMDATQQRQTLAMCIGWIAVMLLYTIHGTKKAVIVFVALCIVSSLIHISCVFYLLILFVKYYDEKKLYIISVIIIAALLIIGPLTLKIIGLKFFSAEKINRVYNMSYDEKSRISTWIRMIVSFLSYVIPYLYTKYTRARKIDKFQTFVYKINIILLATFPLILFTNDFYRIQQIAIVFNYCAISRWLVSCKKNGRYKIIKSNLVYEFTAFFSAVLMLYLLVLRSNNINTVFRAFFENNTLLSY